MKTHGYIPVMAMRDFSPDAEKPYRRLTPFQLTTNELLKKLGSKGPDGCGRQCDCFDVCMFGRAIVERTKEMKIKAEITLRNREHIIRYFGGWEDLGVWMERHHDHIIAINAHLREKRETKTEGNNG